MADPIEETRRLRDELVALGVTGAGPAFETATKTALPVTYNLVVWCAGGVFFWRAGDDFERFDTHPADDPAGAARRVKDRYKWLRGRRDLYYG